MGNIYNKNSVNTPVYQLDKVNGLFIISGRSIQLNPFKFWEPIKLLLLDYMKNPNVKTCIRFELEYINSSSVEQIFNFLKLAKKLNSSERQIEIEWIYDEDDFQMIDIGNCIQELLKIPMNYIEISSINKTK